MRTYCTTAMRIDPKDGDVLSLPGVWGDQYLYLTVRVLVSIESFWACVYLSVLLLHPNSPAAKLEEGCDEIPSFMTHPFELTSPLESLLGNYFNVSFAFHLIYFLFEDS